MICFPGFLLSGLRGNLMNPTDVFFGTGMRIRHFSCCQICRRMEHSAPDSCRPGRRFHSQAAQLSAPDAHDGFLQVVQLNAFLILLNKEVIIGYYFRERFLIQPTFNNKADGWKQIWRDTRTNQECFLSTE